MQWWHVILWEHLLFLDLKNIATIFEPFFKEPSSLFFVCFEFISFRERRGEMQSWIIMNRNVSAHLSLTVVCFKLLDFFFFLNSAVFDHGWLTFLRVVVLLTHLQLMNWWKFCKSGQKKTKKRKHVNNLNKSFVGWRDVSY